MSVLGSISLPSLAYERRLTLYFDILGWKGLIDEAGSDPSKIAILRYILQMFSIFRDQQLSNAEDGAYISTFSDNVVISTYYSEDRLLPLLESIGQVQLGLAVLGILMRGAITLGDLHHDDSVVFGPALNRAHYLESKIADYPRIILDNDCPELLVGNCYFLKSLNGISYVAPFTREFAQSRAQAPNEAELRQALQQSVGGDFSPSPSAENFEMMARHCLQIVTWQLDQKIARNPPAKDLRKLQWLKGELPQ